MSNAAPPPGYGNPPNPTAPPGLAPTLDAFPPLPPNAAPGASPSSPNRSTPLWIGIGCLASLLVVVIGVAAVGLYWAWQRINELEAQVASVSGIKSALPSTLGLSTNCKAAYDCCVKITSTAGNAAIAAQCEAIKAQGRSDVECATALSGYEKVAQSRSLSCR
ncbi:MAG TPA: hypothetical protein VIV60_30210 [Polyangiaceae bacterium]